MGPHLPFTFPWLAMAALASTQSVVDDASAMLLLQTTLQLKHNNVPSDALQIDCNLENPPPSYDSYDCWFVRRLIEFVEKEAVQSNVSSVIEAFNAFSALHAREGNFATFQSFSFTLEVAELIKEKQPKVGAELGSLLGYSALHFAPLMAQSLYYTVDPLFEIARDSIFSHAGIQDRIQNYKGYSVDFLRFAAKKGIQFDFLLIDHGLDEITDLKIVVESKLLLQGAILVFDNAGPDVFQFMLASGKFHILRTLDQMGTIIATFK